MPTALQFYQPNCYFDFKPNILSISLLFCQPLRNFPLLYLFISYSAILYSTALIYLLLYYSVCNCVHHSIILFIRLSLCPAFGHFVYSSAALSQILLICLPLNHFTYCSTILSIYPTILSTVVLFFSSASPLFYLSFCYFGHNLFI